MQKIIAINKACKKLNAWRLLNCSIYVTVEPCPMCMGAILNAQIKRLIFGCFDTKNGCCGSVTNFLNLAFAYKKIIVTNEILKDECASLMSNFFKQKRSKNFN